MNQIVRAEYGARTKTIDAFRIGGQRGANRYARRSREAFAKAVPFCPDSPVVKMLKGAMDALRSLNDASKKLEDMPQYKQAQTAFAAGGDTAHALDVTA